MSTITLGEIRIDRVVEIDRSSFPTTSMLPAASTDALARHLHWLKPSFWDSRTDDLGSRVQSYLVRTPEHTVLMDTCVGNNKDRVGAPAWHMRTGTFLDDLAALGVRPEDIDHVVCTHLHVDHVGWNTSLVDGRWVPTFANAEYVFVGEEWEFWKHQSDRGAENDGCIVDSVTPIVESGRARLVDTTYTLGRHLRFESTPGHTPGHVAVRLSTSAGEAVFSGDLMHRIVQVAEPGWSSRFCYEPERAAKTRRDFVERYADSGVLVCAAHFPTPGYIVREDGAHRFRPGP